MSVTCFIAGMVHGMPIHRRMRRNIVGWNISPAGLKPELSDAFVLLGTSVMGVQSTHLLGVLIVLLSKEEQYHIHAGDCIPHMLDEMPPFSVDFAVFSPPFPSLFSYTSLPEDIGNSEDLKSEAKLHLGYFYRGLERVLKPGRVAVVHVMQIPGLMRNNEAGMIDFRGLNIRLGIRAGLQYHYDWMVTKNPQSQAIRTHSHSLLFVTLERDRAACRGALGDYLIKFVAGGVNEVPIDSPGIRRDEWINWAEAAWNWHDIRETDTLNTKNAKGEHDTKHICPLQLGVIDRLIRLYSNPGEIVFSPFAGIGSEGHCAIKHGRRFYGCEIKTEYVDEMERNLKKACCTQKESTPLFSAFQEESHEHSTPVC